jgi:hypothetical protein
VQKFLPIGTKVPYPAKEQEIEFDPLTTTDVPALSLAPMTPEGSGLHECRLLPDTENSPTAASCAENSPTAACCARAGQASAGCNLSPCQMHLCPEDGHELDTQGAEAQPGVLQAYHQLWHRKIAPRAQADVHAFVAADEWQLTNTSDR